MEMTLDPTMVQEMKKELPSILANLKEKKSVETEKILEAILVTVLSNDQTLIKAEERICTLETEVKNLNEKIKQLKVETFRAIVKNIPSTNESDKSGNVETSKEEKATENGEEKKKTKKKKFKPKKPDSKKSEAKKSKTDEGIDEATDQATENDDWDGEEKKDSEKVSKMIFDLLLIEMVITNFEF